MTGSRLLDDSKSFLVWLKNWVEALPVLSLAQAATQPEKTALVSVDVTQGFCVAGMLASPRVAQIAPPVARLFQDCWQAGVRHFILSQDTHDPHAVEFGAWPPHCVAGGAESQPVAELRALPFFDQIEIHPKNSIYTDLSGWLKAHPEVDTFLTVGDCTDLCTYQLAMSLRMDANERQLQRRVIVPANCVQTYDRSVEQAQIEGGLPHPGDLLHAVFLYHMALNGVEVARAVE